MADDHGHSIFHNAYKHLKGAIQTGVDRDRNEEMAAHSPLAKAVGGPQAEKIIRQAIYRDRKRPH